MYYQRDWNLCIEWFKVYALLEKLSKPLMLIYKSQRNLAHKQLTNENLLGSLSKCGRYVLDFLDFWSEWVALSN